MIRTDLVYMRRCLIRNVNVCLPPPIRRTYIVDPWLSILNIVVYIHGEGNGTPLQYSCLENPVDGGAWWAAVHGITKVDMTERLHFHFSL